MRDGGEIHCSKCDRLVTVDELLRDRSKKLGYRSYCKACENARTRARYVANPDLEVKRARRRQWVEANPEKADTIRREWVEQNRDRQAELIRRSRERYPEKQKARRKLRTAVEAGRVVKPDYCESCEVALPSPEIHAHHPDYSKPLDVDWLCRSCHGLLHRLKPVA